MPSWTKAATGLSGREREEREGERGGESDRRWEEEEEGGKDGREVSGREDGRLHNRK